MTQHSESVDKALVQWASAILKHTECRFAALRRILREGKNHEDIKDKKSRRIVIGLALEG